MVHFKLMVIFMLGVLGLCFGSFVNALVWRLHEQSLLTTKTSKKRRQQLSITKGRSMCPDCGHSLSTLDLLPVISWLALNGKCRYCHQTISWQYPAVEAATAGLFIASYCFWPFEFDTSGQILLGLWLIILTGFVALFLYDLKWMILPNRLIYPLTVVAGCYALVHLMSQTNTSVWQLVGSVLVASGLFYVLSFVSNGEWIGDGDIRLGWVIGLVLGRVDLSLLMIFLASLLGTIVSMPLVMKRDFKRHIPFGPFLLAATVIVFLFGQGAIERYVGALL